MKITEYSSEKMSYRKWLLDQEHRNDYIGDLARDMIEDILWKDMPDNCQSFSEVSEHILNERGCCEGCIEAVRKSRREYMGRRQHR